MQIVQNAQVSDTTGDAITAKAGVINKLIKRVGNDGKFLCVY
jgi:hypothetical protein